MLLKLHAKFAPGWVLIQVNFDPIQEIGPKVGDGRSFVRGPYFTKLRYIHLVVIAVLIYTNTLHIIGFLLAKCLSGVIHNCAHMAKSWLNLHPCMSDISCLVQLQVDPLSAACT